MNSEQIRAHFDKELSEAETETILTTFMPAFWLREIALQLAIANEREAAKMKKPERCSSCGLTTEVHADDCPRLKQ